MASLILTQEDYYGLLGVSTHATSEDIKNAFKELALKSHPDKTTVSVDVARFAKCTQAYNVLMDGVSRELYDMVMGFKPETPEQRRILNQMKKAEAERAISLMHGTYECIRHVESSKNGLMIEEALYGNLMQKAIATIDVRIPLQCLVENSVLVIRPGSSKSWMEGFYDPSDSGDNELYIRYVFLNRAHECIFGDLDEVCIPLQEHLIKEGEGEPDHTAELSAIVSSLESPQSPHTAGAVRSALSASTRRSFPFSPLHLPIPVPVFDTTSSSPSSQAREGTQSDKASALSPSSASSSPSSFPSPRSPPSSAPVATIETIVSATPSASLSFKAKREAVRLNEIKKKRRQRLFWLSALLAVLGGLWWAQRRSSKSPAFPALPNASMRGLPSASAGSPSFLTPLVSKIFGSY